MLDSVNDGIRIYRVDAVQRQLHEDPIYLIVIVQFVDLLLEFFLK